MQLKQNALTEHFRRQANGQSSPRLMRNGNPVGMVLVKNKRMAQKEPKIQIVDPNQAVAKRALSQLEAQQGINTGKKPARAHSTPSSRKRKTSVKSTPPKKAIKRARDIFDPK